MTSMWFRAGLAALVAGSLGACAGPGATAVGGVPASPSARVTTASHATPQADETPSEVVHSYFAAATTGDEGAADGYASPGFQGRGTWLHGGVRDVKVADTSTPYDTSYNDSYLKSYEHVEQVWVSYTVTSPVGGLSAGPSGASYLVARHSNADPWLVADVTAA